MMDTILRVVIIFVIFGMITAYIIYTKKDKWLEQQTLIAHLLNIKTIIAFTQKHRGMCAAYIQGDKTALEVLTNIDNTIQPIAQKLNGEPLLLQQDRWIGHMDHWQRLRKQFKQLDVEASFEQHTNLITNLLYLFEDVSEQRKFNKYSDTDKFSRSVLWQDLPFTAEYVGQSRAIGVAIVSSGVCTQVDKVKLGYLVTKITELSNRVFTSLKKNGSEQIQFINQAEAACENFIRLLQKELLEVNTVKISTQEYFSSASQTIDSINRLLDAELNTLQDKIKQSY